MNIATFQPRGANVLVRRLELTEAETGGIIVPGNEYGNYAFAEILALGTGNSCVSHVGTWASQEGDVDSRYMGELADLKVGDVVLMMTGHPGSPFSNQPKMETTLPFTVDGERVELIGEGKIVAVVTKSEESS